MSCPAFEPLIALYVEGEASGGEAVQVEQHLPGCAACRELLEDLQSTQSALKDLRMEPVDPALVAAVRAGVLSGIDGRRRLFWPWAAALAAAIGLAAILLAPPRKPGSPPMPVAVARPPAPAMEPPRRELPVSRAKVRRPRRRSKPEHPAEPLVVKMLTDDPDVVIIWLVDQTGD
ncbi:MAG TPA: zf-HC2 domain-containing protein [Bryobacteraceae bacterium]|jgi:anti-sigma factor RsiW|nr:zf-HC2 domain-containing protein [Bryobacteraceae bacterium]